MKRSLIPRLVALAMIIIAGTYYIVFDIFGANFGAGPFPVAVQFEAAGGLYPGAGVTYNGVEVGKVSALDLSPTGITAHLAITAGTKIPANSRANIRDLSALGEEYVDFVPSGPGPILKAGAMIPPSRTSAPIPISTTLLDLGNLLQSLDNNDLQTDETLVGQSFHNTGDDVRQIVVTGRSLAQALIDSGPATTEIINNSQPLLQTALDTNTELSGFLANLNQFSQTLAQSNNALVNDLNSGNSAAGQSEQLLSQGASGQSLAPAIDAVLAGFGKAAHVASQYQPQIASLFGVLPLLTDELAQSSAGGSLHGSLAINGSNTVCPYLPASALKGPTQVDSSSAALANSCATSAPDLLQHGAASSPVVAP